MLPTDYTEGERFVQQYTDEEHIARHNAAIVADQLIANPILFILNQRFFFTASMDGQGMVWASVLAGDEGFIGIKDLHHISIYPTLVTSGSDDVFWGNIRWQSQIGMLFIDLATRRRFRVNGDIYPISAGPGWQVTVEQAYPNCPKYIQRRVVARGVPPAGTPNKDLHSWISEADTFFVASASKDGRLDVSHRGGNPGFIRWVDEKTIRIPDYSGNSMFNTLGNFYEYPEAGLLFIDFTNGGTLQLTGRVVLHLQDEGEEVFTGGTNRTWDFIIERHVFQASLRGFTTRFIDYSPYNP